MSPDKIFIYVDDVRMSLAKFMAMDQSKVQTVYASGCTALTELKADAAEYVDARGCTALTELDQIDVGKDSRDYEFTGIKLRGQWRVIAGCRNKSIPDARKHWGPGGPSDRADCLALVEKIADYAAKNGPVKTAKTEADKLT